MTITQIRCFCTCTTASAVCSRWSEHDPTHYGKGYRGGLPTICAE